MSELTRDELYEEYAFEYPEPFGDIITSMGKFENESVVVAYLWQYDAPQADEYNWAIYPVDDNLRLIFPTEIDDEIVAIGLYESDDGFIHSSWMTQAELVEYNEREPVEEEELA